MISKCYSFTEGCKYCQKSANICGYDEDDEEGAWVKDNVLSTSQEEDFGGYAYTSFEINYCPMCGTNLQQEK